MTENTMIPTNAANGNDHGFALFFKFSLLQWKLV